MFLILSAILLTLHSCQTDTREGSEPDNRDVNTQQDTPVKLIEYLIGDWEMASTAGGQENGNQQGAPGERLTFTSEARYIAYDGNQKVDSGAYRMNEQLNNLYLESEANETPREFELDLESRELTLKPRDAQENGARAYVYRRVGEASVPPDKSAEGDETEQTEGQ